MNITYFTSFALALSLIVSSQTVKAASEPQVYYSYTNGAFNSSAMVSAFAEYTMLHGQNIDEALTNGVVESNFKLPLIPRSKIYFTKNYSEMGLGEPFVRIKPCLEKSIQIYQNWIKNSDLKLPVIFSIAPGHDSYVGVISQTKNSKGLAIDPIHKALQVVVGGSKLFKSSDLTCNIPSVEMIQKAIAQAEADRAKNIQDRSLNVDGNSARTSNGAQ